MRSVEKLSSRGRRSLAVFLLTALTAALATAAIACGGGETVIQTVVVEREVPGETVVQTVVVEREVQVAGETVVPDCRRRKRSRSRR